MYLALCLLLAVGALAQVPTTCPGPKQFEGRFQRYDRERRGQVRGAMAYDETQRRVREFEDIDIAGKKQAFDILRLYDQNVEYIVDRSTRKCNITTPTRRFHPIGVPPDAKFIGEGVIGAAGIVGESVTVATFEGTYEDAKFFVSVTYPDCFPVTSGFKSANDTGFTSFYDLQAGISDPDLFFPPKECTLH
ncbi:mammalian ependymin-related protein 1 isoform X2 [Aplysia californica]|uniref:Mammalian ependymin-related protein 1 isoform X2 n=1 Tax=Aplysia californica TaxID=6500 RepID=A0ABM1A893_APLCA|nr:mammalian ependymin-related protein 1 isoform X2 [Aplysia californica]